MSITYHTAEPVLDLVGKYESRGNYEIVYSGIPQGLRPIQLTAMTIAEVREWQERVVQRGAKSSAAGKYQIIRKTLDAILAQTGIKTSRKFDKAAQDEMAMHLLKGRGFAAFLSDKIDAEDMAIALAKEWASLPVPCDMQGKHRWVKAGQSYYAGDGLNKAHASVGEVSQALEIARERYRSGWTPPKPTPDAASPGAIIFVIIAAIAALIALKG